MALTNRITKRVDLAHEPGAWLEVRLPSLAILDRARQARSRKAIELMAGLDLSGYQQFAQPQEAAKPDAATEFDWQTLLAACVTAWSYEEPVTPENVGELDEPTVKAVLAALLPSETEAELKNA